MAITFETVILRFRDLVTAESETIARHVSVIDKYGYVWWGWWKKGNEKTPVDEFASLSIRAKSRPIDIYLIDSGQNLAYCATCEDVQLKTEGKIPSPDKEKTPEYYCDQEYFAWFKFTKIELCEKNCLAAFSCIECKSLFCDENADYSKFDNKKIYSIEELTQQNRTVWFVRKARDSDRDNEIILLNSDVVQPTYFSVKYHQSSGDTIVWLSDLHLPDGVFHLKRGTYHQTLAQHLLSCIGERRVAGLLISGDITSRAEEVGFQQAQQLLKDLNYEIPSLNSENILICPGNHDFSRECSDLPRDTAPAFIYDRPENTVGFSNFYYALYRMKPNKFFASGKKLLLTSGHILEIAALNSLILQQYPNFDGHGYLTQDQLDFVAEEMGWNKNNCQNAIRIVMMHHHYLPTCYTETIDISRASSVVYDANRLMNWLVKYNVKLLLHGHKHKSFVSQISCSIGPANEITTKNMQPITVVGMGGTGAPGSDNKFATIRFNKHEIIVEFHRIHSDEATEDTISQTVKISFE